MRALFLFSFGIFGVGCAQRLDDVDERISDLQHRTTVLEAKTGAPVGTDRELLEGQKIADVRSQLSSIRNEMTILAGKVEALEYETKRISTRVESVAQDSEQKLREINKKKEALAPPTEGSVQTAGGADADFEKALKAHQEGDYPGAERGFEDFLKKHPKHPLASRAIFWMGDGYMAQKLYKKAISKFQDLIDRFPKSDKRCDAMGKQISAFKELKMEKEAKVFSQVRESECKSN